MVNDADETTPLLVPSLTALLNDVAIIQEPRTKVVPGVEEEAASGSAEATNDDQSEIAFASPLTIVSVLTIGKI